MCAQAIFIIRTYAFTGRNKFILVFLVAAWVALLGSYLWIMSTRWFFPVELGSLFGDSPCFATDDPPSRHSEADFQHFSPRSNAILRLATFLLDSFMTAIVFIHTIRIQALRSQLAQAFIGQGLMAYVFLSGLNLVVAIIFFMPDRRFDGLGIFLGPTSAIMACRLILMLPRRTDPTSTTQLRAQSQLIQDGLEFTFAVPESISIDDDELDLHHPIERWN